MLSGGLDSILAGKVLKDQGIELFALNFITPFCMCTSKGCKSEALKSAKELDIPLQIIAAGEEYVQIIKKPKYGYGKNMNPCIDCRIFMFSSAKTIMKETGARFIVTGEVLGERPMSQRKWAMKTIEKASGLEGYILRPLSAKLLKPTMPEKEGWVKREELLAIQGRSRKPQMELAIELGVTDYPCPAGGCRLTDPHFAKRLRNSLDHGEDTLIDIRLLKYGRHFRLPSRVKVIVGRNEKENRTIESLSPEGTYIIECAESAEGPTTLLNHCKEDGDVFLAGALTLRYSDHPESYGKVKIRKKGEANIDYCTVNKIEENELIQYRI